MTKRPTRATTGGRAYLDLRKLARANQRPTDELLQLYALEGFLARLVLSSFAKSFVLKGGVLLAAFDARRPTKDIDLSASGLANDTETIRAAVRSIAEHEIDDGLEFDPEAATAAIIRDDDDYSGVRVTIPCKLASATVIFHVDVNVGDPIWPAPSEVSVPRVLGGDPLRVLGYPISMVLAEKIVTVLQRGSANTRWRDFADIVLLARRHSMEFAELHGAISVVADHRATELHLVRDVLAGFATTAQSRWTAWRRRLLLQGSLPESFASLLDELIAFADPVLGAEATDTTWNPETATWARGDD